MEVTVYNNDIAQAARVLQRKFKKEYAGAFRVRSFPKPSDRKKEKENIAQRRQKKQQGRRARARKRA